MDDKWKMTDEWEWNNATKITLISVIIGIVIWIGWHVLTNKSENEELQRLSRKRHGANDHKSNITDW